MFLVTTNKPKQILYFIFAGHVSAAELREGQKEVMLLLDVFNKGFRTVTDFSHLQSLEPECAQIIGEVMEVCDRKGVETVVRIVPDPTKDIGLSILSSFHYHRHPRVVVCNGMEDAARALGI